MNLFPSEIIKQLRQIALDCENSERWPKTGASTWPKESTVEWQAADLIETYKREIDNYEMLYYNVAKALDNFDRPDVRRQSVRPFRVKLRKKF